MCGRGRGERLRELPERGPAPERARGGEALGRRVGVAVGQRLAALLAQPLEPQQVDGLRRDLEPVARRTRLQRPARQDLAELRDVDVHHLHRRGGHALAPQRVDERIDRHGPVRLEQQAGEQRALALPTGGHGHAAVHDLQRAEEPVLRPVVRELHGRMPDVSLGERLHRLRIAHPARHDTTVPGCRWRRHGAVPRPRCGLPHRSAATRRFPLEPRGSGIVAGRIAGARRGPTRSPPCGYCWNWQKSRPGSSPSSVTDRCLGALESPRQGGCATRRVADEAELRLWPLADARRTTRSSASSSRSRREGDGGSSSSSRFGAEALASRLRPNTKRCKSTLAALSLIRSAATGIVSHGPGSRGGGWHR